MFLPSFISILRCFAQVFLFEFGLGYWSLMQEFSPRQWLHMIFVWNNWQIREIVKAECVRLRRKFKKIDDQLLWEEYSIPEARRNASWAVYRRQAIDLMDNNCSLPVIKNVIGQHDNQKCWQKQILVISNDFLKKNTCTTDFFLGYKHPMSPESQRDRGWKTPAWELGILTLWAGLCKLLQLYTFAYGSLSLLIELHWIKYKVEQMNNCALV